MLIVTTQDGRRSQADQRGENISLGENLHRNAHSSDIRAILVGVRCLFFETPLVYAEKYYREELPLL